MVVEITCPKCGKEFEVDVWDDGACECGNNYYFSEDCLDDFSDCWAVIDWDVWGSDDE